MQDITKLFDLYAGKEKPEKKTKRQIREDKENDKILMGRVDDCEKEPSLTKSQKEEDYVKDDFVRSDSEEIEKVKRLRKVQRDRSRDKEDEQEETERKNEKAKQEEMMTAMLGVFKSMNEQMQKMNERLEKLEKKPDEKGKEQKPEEKVEPEFAEPRKAFLFEVLPDNWSRFDYMRAVAYIVGVLKKSNKKEQVEYKPKKIANLIRIETKESLLFTQKTIRVAPKGENQQGFSIKQYPCEENCITWSKVLMYKKNN